LLYHAELQRRNIEENQAQIKCLGFNNKVLNRWFLK
jgi:hypothetical protein